MAVKQRGEGYSWFEIPAAEQVMHKGHTPVLHAAPSAPTDTSRVDTIWLAPRVLGLIVSSWYNIELAVDKEKWVLVSI